MKRTLEERIKTLEQQLNRKREYAPQREHVSRFNNRHNAIKILVVRLATLHTQRRKEQQA